jgi:hypothetical protein
MANIPRWDEMCFVCGGPPYAPNIYHTSFPYDMDGWMEEVDRLMCECLAGLDWLNHSIGITEIGDIIPLGKYDTTNGRFEIPHRNDQFYGLEKLLLAELPEQHHHGLTCHKQCYELIEQQLHHKLQVHDVWPLVLGKQVENGHNFVWTDKHRILNYHFNHQFLFPEIVFAGKWWMLCDPSSNKMNAKRIVEAWKPIVGKSANMNVALQSKSPCYTIATFDIIDKIGEWVE